ncbi:MAG: chemotaxis protein CheX [Myxococcota bacterium]
MDLAREDIVALVEHTWQTLFGDAIELCPPFTLGPDGLRASIEISGTWAGCVVLDYPAASAEAIACGLLEAKPGELESEAIVDAAGEMANILAGNLKSMLPQPSRLGLPTTISGPSLLETADFSDENHQIVSFVWNNTPISVSIRPNTGTGGA